MNKLLDRLYDHADYVRFCKKSKISISKKAKINLVQRIHKDISDINVIRTCDKNGFYLLSRGYDISKRILSCAFMQEKNMSLAECRKLIIETKNVDKRIKSTAFKVPYGGLLHKNFIKLGANITGVKLYAKVDDGINALKDCKYQKLKFRLLKKSELTKTISLEMSAHKNSSSTRLKKINKTMMTNFHTQMIKSKFMYCAELEGEVVGVIAISHDLLKRGHIMSIAVDPKFQGLGISKFLYLNAFKIWKKQGVKSYSGVSTTSEVLRLAKKLKRIPMTIYLEF